MKKKVSYSKSWAISYRLLKRNEKTYIDRKIRNVLNKRLCDLDILAKGNSLYFLDGKIVLVYKYINNKKVQLVDIVNRNFVILAKNDQL